MLLYNPEVNLTLEDLGLGIGCRFLYPRQHKWTLYMIAVSRILVQKRGNQTSCYDFGENKINEAFGEHFK
jgi:hypothetical protein